MLELIVILVVLFVVLPTLGVVIPAPLSKILGIVLFVIVLYWLFGLVGGGFPRLR